MQASNSQESKGAERDVCTRCRHLRHQHRDSFGETECAMEDCGCLSFTRSQNPAYLSHNMPTQAVSAGEIVAEVDAAFDKLGRAEIANIALQTSPQVEAGAQGDRSGESASDRREAMLSETLAHVLIAAGVITGGQSLTGPELIHLAETYAEHLEESAQPSAPAPAAAIELPELDVTEEDRNQRWAGLGTDINISHSELREIHAIRLCRERQLRAALQDAASAKAERDKLQAFKDYVHKRLDDAGIPVDPPSEHREQGCRIGGRLDIALAADQASETLRGAVRELRDAARLAINTPEYARGYEDVYARVTKAITDASALLGEEGGAATDGSVRRGR